MKLTHYVREENIEKKNGNLNNKYANKRISFQNQVKVTQHLWVEADQTILGTRQFEPRQINEVMNPVCGRDKSDFCDQFNKFTIQEPDHIRS